MLSPPAARRSQAAEVLTSGTWAHRDRHSCLCGNGMIQQKSLHAILRSSIFPTLLIPLFLTQTNCLFPRSLLFAPLRWCAKHARARSESRAKPARNARQAHINALFYNPGLRMSAAVSSSTPRRATSPVIMRGALGSLPPKTTNQIPAFPLDIPMISRYVDV